MQYAWPEDTPKSVNKLVKDYTVKLYAAEPIAIFDCYGRESKSTSHDEDFWNSVLRAIDQSNLIVEMKEFILKEQTAPDEQLKRDYQVRESWY